jgi:hypothetical protein
MKKSAAFVLMLCALGACEENVNPVPNSLLPMDYRSTYATVRNCRPSIDHDLRYIVVLTSPQATDAYRSGPYPFAPGAVVVKEEYADPSCRGLVGWTLMRKEPAGYDPGFGDWRWQKVDGEGKVLQDGKLDRCRSCHASQSSCRLRDFTCTDP